MSRTLLETMGLDPAKETPGRQIVRHKGDALVEGMKMALKAGWQGHKKLSLDRNKGMPQLWKAAAHENHYTCVVKRITHAKIETCTKDPSSPKTEEAWFRKDNDPVTRIRYGR